MNGTGQALATAKGISLVVQIDLTVIKWTGHGGARERAPTNAVFFTESLLLPFSLSLDFITCLCIKLLILLKEESPLSLNVLSSSFPL